MVGLDRATEAPPDLLNPSATALRLWSQSYVFALGRIANVSSSYNNDHDLNALPQVQAITVTTATMNLNFMVRTHGGSATT